MKHIVIFILWMFFAFSNIAPAAAGNFRVITGFLPPWSIEGDAERPGLFIEIVREALFRAGYDTPVEIIPWTRAQFIAKNEENVLVFPMTRINHRENHYTWLHNVRPLEMVFISYRHDDLEMKDALGFDRILVQQKTPPQIMLQERNFENLTDIPDVTLNIPRILKTGRADAWFTAKDMGNWVWKLTPHMPLPHIGPTIVENDQYIATSHTFPKDAAEKINAALHQMQNDGTIKKIEARYSRSGDLLLD